MKIKRMFCGIFAAFLIAYMPLTAYASIATSVAVRAGEYVINLILNACGVDFSASAVTSILGEWTDYDDYIAKGAKGELGAFSQYLYNQSLNAETEELKENARKQIEALNNAVNSAWGAVISGVKGLISAVKNWLLSPEISGYCTDATTYFAYQGNNTNFEFGVDSFISSERYPIRMPNSYTYAYGVINNSANEFSFSSISPSYYTGYAYVANYYKPKTVEVFGLARAVVSGTRVDFYMKDGETYKDYKFFYHYESAVDADGNYKFSKSDSCDGTITYTVCKEIHVGNFPFPVFTNVEAMENYCKTGEIADVYESGKVALKADAINTDIQNMPLKSIPDTITLPQEKDVALHAQNISGALVTGQDALKTALDGAGLAIDWGEETTEDKTNENDAALKGIAGAIEALPDKLEKKMETDGETAKDRLNLPALITNKFPFCIPFDLIYLIETLSADDEEIPTITIPMKLDYLNFHYEHEFVLDFADYNVLAVILRVMLDSLFCAGLISATRNLIRG